jgi:hypothetical protein
MCAGVPASAWSQSDSSETKVLVRYVFTLDEIPMHINFGVHRRLAIHGVLLAPRPLIV